MSHSSPLADSQRRRVLQLAAAQGGALALGAAGFGAARAAAYPTQPVKFIVGNGPGSAAR